MGSGIGPRREEKGGRGKEEGGKMAEMGLRSGKVNADNIMGCYRLLQIVHLESSRRAVEVLPECDPAYPDCLVLRAYAGNAYIISLTPIP